MMHMKELTLSTNEFKALASQTRVKIIKLLNERNHTLSELSKKLGLASPTIKQHLETLVESEIIEQKDEGRKWKYYSLTRKGKNMLQPEQTNFVLLLGISSIALFGLILMLAFTLSNSYFAPNSVEETFGMAKIESKEAAISEASPGPETPNESQADQEQRTLLSPMIAGPLIPVIGLIIAAIIVFSLLVGLSLAKIRKN